MRDPVLYQRLKAFCFDAPATSLTFARRLAREHGWTMAFAERVIAEYLRFIYLARVSDFPITPSVAVDLAWHLHLVYTRSYWEDLCRGVLGCPLHHGPTRGGTQENEKYHEQYQRTLEAYAAEFGAAPPADIWPPAQERFAPESQPQSVLPKDYWLLNKRRVRRLGVGVACAAVVGLAGLGAKGSEFEDGTVVLLAAFGIALFLWWLRSKKRWHRNNRDGHHGSGCGAECHSGCSDGCGSGCGGGGGCGDGGD